MPDTTISALDIMVFICSPCWFSCVLNTRYTASLYCARSDAARCGIVTREGKLVTLGRITEDKLIHRQIDTMALLRQQGVDDIVMEGSRQTASP